MNISEIWKNHADFVYNLCLSKVKDPDAAKDIRQNVFLKIMNTKCPFKEGSNIKTWLYTITSRCYIDYYRDKKRQRYIAKGYLQIEKPYEYDSDIGRLKDNGAHETLCPVSQIMVDLFREGWSKRELSKVFGFDLPQINKKLKAGLSYLRDSLN